MVLLTVVLVLLASVACAQPVWDLFVVVMVGGAFSAQLAHAIMVFRIEPEMSSDVVVGLKRINSFGKTLVRHIQQSVDQQQY